MAYRTFDGSVDVSNNIRSITCIIAVFRLWRLLLSCFNEAGLSLTGSNSVNGSSKYQIINVVQLTTSLGNIGILARAPTRLDRFDFDWDLRLILENAFSFAMTDLGL